MSLKLVCRIVAVLGGLLAGATAASAAEVTFSLDYTILGRHSPYYVAMDKGYYRQEGIDVKFIPAKGSGQVVSALAGGIAQFGLVDVPALVFARAAGARLRTVAVIYQKSPYAIYSLNPGANITRPSQVKGVDLAVGAETFIRPFMEGFMRLNHEDPAQLRFVNISPASRIPMLVSHAVPAIFTFLLNEPGLRPLVHGAELKRLMLSDYGLQLYSLGITVPESLIAKDPKLVRGFVRASLRGWQDALRDPAGAVAIEGKYVPALNKAIAVQELNLLRSLVVTPDTGAHGLGAISPGMMQTTRDFVIKNAGVKGTPPQAADLYDARFLPAQPILP
ncbi:MAG TPA: ABC transporter substrate-binding protein [Rhizomicrobium sp.]|nr:ABC transporter substrate-binding protein [Rhizomicrobium sp.]